MPKLNTLKDFDKFIDQRLQGIGSNPRPVNDLSNKLKQSIMKRKRLPKW